MRPTRDEAVATVRRALGRVEGILAHRRAAAEASVAEAAAEVDERRRELAAGHAEITAALSGAGGDTAPLPDRWREIAGRAAPGVASAAWDAWPEGPGPAAARPWLYRVGTAHAVIDRAKPAPAPARAARPVSGAGDPPATVPPATVPAQPGPGDGAGPAAAGDDPGAPDDGWPLPPVPALVPLLGRGHVGIAGARTRERAAAAESVISGLLLRLVAAAPPGAVRVDVFDPRRLGAGLGGLLALDRPGLLTTYAPHEFDNLLKSLTREIRRIQGSVLAGRFADLEELAARTGRRPEPWRVVVVYAPAHGFDDDVLSRLHGVMHAGPACGIHLVCCDVPMTGIDDAEVLTLRPDGLATLGSLPSMLIRPDPPAPPELVRAVCEQVVTRLGEGRAARRFGDLLPPQMWQESSASGVRAPVGDAIEGGDAPVEVLLGDDPPHALIGGPSGSGKTNFLYALIGSLAARYAPDELEFYLLDFKEGVSFARFARGRKDPSWLPHARLVGVNINSDREFGLALLRYLAEQLRLRAEAAKTHEVTKLEELRAEDPSGRWPRIVAVIDEFQVLLGRRDKITDEAVTLLEDLARRGRSQGIHLVLASQDVNSVEALWGRSSILAQFTLRVALPKARRVLADDNREADRIPRFCAVVNPDSGAETANRVVRLPDAGLPGTLDLLQRDLWQRRPEQVTEPRLFDGAYVPDMLTGGAYAALAPGDGVPSALVGQVIDLSGSAARVRFGRSPGRNLAVIGTRAGEACDVLGSAVLSLARQHHPGTAAFTLVVLDDDAAAPASDAHASLRRDGHDATLHGLADLPELLAEAAARIDAALTGGPPADGPRVRYLVLYAVDAAGGVLGGGGAFASSPGLDALRRTVQRGPETRTHVLGWWRTAGRLKDDLAGMAARLDDVGAWVALDVPGAELAPLPGGGLVTWSPRERRALFFDRAVHDQPQPVIPYRLGGTTGERP